MALLDTPLTSTHPTPSRTGGLRLRLRHTGRSTVLGLAAFVPCALLPLWLTAAALTPLTFLAPALIPATWLVRRFADAHRRSAVRVLGTTVETPYAEFDGTGPVRRIVTILRDPASWRDALWLLVHAVVASVLSLLSAILLLAVVFYAIFPFLYAVTPPEAFRDAYGLFTIDSLAESFAFVPLAAVAFGLWWVTALPVAKAVAATDRALLQPRRVRTEPETRYAA